MLNPLRRCLSLLLVLLLSFGPELSYAQGMILPEPGTLVSQSAAFVPVILKGITVHPEDPFLFNFIVDTGNTGLSANGEDPRLAQESQELVKYFLASMTIPDKDQWVNLSPYESDRIVSEELGQTAMGRDMLAQDYLLKQITSSLIYPEKELGRTFWARVYERARKEYGVTDVPMDVFNKVWVTADSAAVYVRGNTAYVANSHLKVMLESDYLAMQKAEAGRPGAGDKPEKDVSEISKQIIREIVLPELEKEVNAGKNFAVLRQIFHSMILATWYKKNLKAALLSQVYADKNKMAGIERGGKIDPQQIYLRYVEAFKKGAFNYIKEEVDQASGDVVPRKYFSGGVVKPSDVSFAQAPGDAAAKAGDLVNVEVEVAPMDASRRAIRRPNVDPEALANAGDRRRMETARRDERLARMAEKGTLPGLAERREADGPDAAAKAVDVFAIARDVERQVVSGRAALLNDPEVKARYAFAKESLPSDAIIENDPDKSLGGWGNAFWLAAFSTERLDEAIANAQAFVRQGKKYKVVYHKPQPEVIFISDKNMPAKTYRFELTAKEHPERIEVVADPSEKVVGEWEQTLRGGELVARFGWSKKLSYPEAEQQAIRRSALVQEGGRIDTRVFSSAEAFDVIFRISSGTVDSLKDGNIIYDIIVRPAEQSANEEQQYYKGYVSLTFQDGRVTGHGDFYSNDQRLKDLPWLGAFVAEKLAALKGASFARAKNTGVAGRINSYDPAEKVARRTVLVVDGDEQVRDMLELVIEANYSDFQVKIVIVSNMKEAQDFLGTADARARLAAVITDTDMGGPGVNGPDLVGWMADTFSPEDLGQVHVYATSALMTDGEKAAYQKVVGDRIPSLVFADKVPFTGLLMNKQVVLAAPAENAVGGIDLNAGKMDLAETGNAVLMQFDPVMIAQFRKGDFTGLTPIIRSIVPIQSLVF